MTTAVELFEQVMNLFEKVPTHRVYFTLKMMKIKRVQERTVEYVRACVALHEAGLPVTTELIRAMGVSLKPLGALHTLGDKNVLTMKRGGKSKLHIWTLNPAFLKHYYEGET